MAPAASAADLGSPLNGDLEGGFPELLTRLGVVIDAQLFDLACTHRSFAYEAGGIPHNERLEFLGDSVLGVIVTEHLYRAYPDFPEGRLAKLRAAVVSSVSLARVARRLHVGRLIKLGHGEVTTGGDDKSSILADTLEALIGAVFLSSGSEGAQRLVHHLFDPLVESAAQLGAGLDWKTSLQEICASRGWPTPGYLISESGPDHDKRFEARVEVDGRQFDPGRGRNKKQAEQQAAEYAFRALSQELGEPDPA